jgi:signal transduction histidine kinase
VLRVTRKSFALFSIVSIVAVLLSDLSAERSFLGTFRILLLGVIVTAIAAVVIFGLQFFILKLSISQMLKAILILIAIPIAGAVRGFALYQLSDAFGFESPTSHALRVFNSANTTLVWLTLISIALQTQSAYRQQFEALLRQAMLKKFASISAQTLNKEIDEIESDLQKIGRDQTYHDLDPSVLLRAAQEVRKIIKTSIRPLSHRLWLDSQSAIPRINLKALFVDSIGNLKYSFWFVGSVYLTLSTVNLNSTLGIEEAAKRSIIGAFFILIAHLIFQRIIKNLEGRHLLISTVFLLVVGFIGMFAALVFSSFEGFEKFNFTYLLALPYAPSIIILESMARLAISDRNHIVRNIELLALAEPEDARGEMQYQSAQVASYLHNSLQSELTTIALQLEAAAAASDPEVSRRTMERLGALINRSIGDDFADFYRTPTERLGNVVTAWDGILDITLDVPEDCLQDNSRNIMLVQFIEEVASNAVRYGEATKLKVEAKLLPSGAVQLRTVNNGTGLNSNGSGLGKKWMQSHSLVKPLITRHGDSFEMVVEL